MLGENITKENLFEVMHKMKDEKSPFIDGRPYDFFENVKGG
jgi:hypothetical protein